MKRIILLTSVICTLFILLSCSDDEVNNQENNIGIENNKEQAMEIAENFVEKMYTISYENVQLEEPEDVVAYKELFSVYLTEEAFEDLAPKELVSQATWAEEEEVNLTVKNFEVKDLEEKESEDAIDITFTFTIQIEDKQENMQDEKIDGEMTIVKENESNLKIGRYYDQIFTLYQSK